MNRLSKKTTRRFYAADASIVALRERWKALVVEDCRRAAIARRARKQESGIDPETIEPQVLDARHHLLYAILRGKDWRKGFAPCADVNRLENGYARWAAATRAIRSLHDPVREGELTAPFDGLLSDGALSAIRAAVPKGAGWSWQADLDAMDAYADIDEEDEP